MNAASAFENGSLTELRSLAVRRFKTGGATAPDVSLLACEDRYAVLKDYSSTTSWFAFCIGPLLIWREKTALLSLHSVSGVPRVIRTVGVRAVLIEYVPAVPLPEADTDDGVFERIEHLVDSMHAAGVAHADLRAARNILVSPTGMPYIVDFVARVRAGARWNPLTRFAFRRFAQADRQAMAKLRWRYAPHLSGPADQRALANRPASERLARWVGCTVRRLTQALAGDRR